MSNPATTGEKPNTPSPVELWERKDVLAYFGGKRPLHTSTLYRGIHDGPLSTAHPCLPQPCAMAPVRVRSRARPHDRRP